MCTAVPTSTKGTRAKGESWAMTAPAVRGRVMSPRVAPVHGNGLPAHLHLLREPEHSGGVDGGHEGAQGRCPRPPTPPRRSRERQQACRLVGGGGPEGGGGGGGGGDSVEPPCPLNLVPLAIKKKLVQAIVSLAKIIDYNR